MSKNKTRPLNLLIVDDDKDYVESLNRDAQGYRIIMKHVCNLEEGKIFLESKDGRSVCGVILDVICMKNKEQKVADKSFITAALKYFGEKLPNIPIVVLTGEPDEYKNLKNLYNGTWAVYSKGRDENNMLSYLRDKAQELERVKILNKYSDVFEIIENYLDDEAEEELINYLKRKSIIDRFAEVIYKITSDNGAHTPYENPDFPPTKYTVQAVTYALLDLLLWFKKVCDGKTM